MWKCGLILGGYLLWLQGMALADPMPKPASPVTKQPLTRKPAQPSEVEKIARLERSIATSKKELEKLKEEETNPESEYKKAEKAFLAIDSQVEATKNNLKNLTKTGKKKEAAELQLELNELLKKHQTYKERFTLAIQERKVLQQKLKSLPEQILQDQKALDELLGKTAPEPKSTTDGASGTPGVKPETESPTNQETGATQSPTPTVPAPGTTAKPGTIVKPGMPPLPVQPSVPATEVKPPPKESEELKQARQEVKKKEIEAQQAKEKALSVTKRTEMLENRIKLEASLKKNAQLKIKTLTRQLAQLQKDLVENQGKPDKAAEIEHHIGDIQNQLVKAQEEEKTISELLGNLQSSLKDLKAEQAVVNHELARKDKEAVNARKKVETLQNPFTPRNLLQWLLDHGGQIVGIILAMIVLRWLVVVFSGRIVSLIMKSRKRSSEREAENRAFTLSGVFRHLCSVMIIGGGTIMLLDTVGIPIGPLMGGAAVLGLAIAFGAQNLIRDYFSGFMVLMEDQYGVNDIIRIGDTAGRVERLSLRTTVLRDVEGVVHFVPHGTIKTVSNLTHGWSRAFFEIGIAYKENVDAVMKILIELGTELRQDPKYAGYILDDPEMLGVDSFDSSAVVLKFFIKTRPLQQWVVKRELLRRIKNRFDELGVEIPFPHRTVYHRYSEGTSIPAPHTSQDSDQERTAA